MLRSKSKPTQKYYKIFTVFLMLQSVSQNMPYHMAKHLSPMSKKTSMKSVCACVLLCTCCAQKLKLLHFPPLRTKNIKNLTVLNYGAKINRKMKGSGVTNAGKSNVQHTDMTCVNMKSWRVHVALKMQQHQPTIKSFSNLSIKTRRLI